MHHRPRIQTKMPLQDNRRFLSSLASPPISPTRSRKSSCSPPQLILTSRRVFRYGLSFCFFLLAYYINILASVVAGWRTPQSDPLPDLGHDLLRPYFIKVEAHVGETMTRHFPDVFILTLLGAVGLFLGLGHTGSQILLISRRIFIVLGLVLLFRAYCVTVTSLPDMSPQCRRQFTPLEDQDSSSHFGFGMPWFGQRTQTILPATGQYKRLPMFPAALKRANKVFWNPFEDTCGDLMFSGHAVALWTLALVFYEYGKSRIMIGLTASVAAAGTIVIVGTMFHYTLDVSVAMFVTYMCWTLVHRYAKNHILQRHAGYLGQIVYWFEATDEEVADDHEKVYY